MTERSPTGVPSCWSCGRSMGRWKKEEIVLWCELHDWEAIKVCTAYEREPGADEPEGET